QFFCFDLCQMALFNYKHALIHFTCSDHCKKESDAVKKSGVDSVRGVLDMFTDLPKKLFDIDEETEWNRTKANGIVRIQSNLSNPIETRLLPHDHFLLPFLLNFTDITENRSLVMDPATGKARFNLLLATKSLVTRVKAVDRKTMAGLHEHLGQGPTFCASCSIKTGDRDGFYAHYLIYTHITQVYLLHNSTQPVNHLNFHALFTTILNVLKKDLVV
ncbi:hypothetical protein PMAYCL1PPCAC_19552, partial [Pristionchus mayeri]